MDSDYAFPPMEFLLKPRAFIEIQRLYERFLAKDSPSKDEQTMLYSSPYLYKVITRWDTLSEAPLEIKDEVERYSQCAFVFRSCEVNK